MRLLVYTPTYAGGLLGECRGSVLPQQFIGEWEWVIDEDDPFPAPDHRNVLAKYRRAKGLALSGGYDALVTVEHDMVLPVDALAKLASTEAAGVVFGVYVLRHGSNVLNAWQYKGDRNLGMSLSLFPNELRILRRAGVGRVSGVGWGCTLIRREVLERAPFDDGGGDCPAGDIPFALWCLRNKITMMARFDVECGHIEEGRVLMPTEAINMTKVEALQRVNVLAGGVSVALEPGQRYVLPDGDALELERAGYVRRIVIERAVAEPMAETAVAVEGRKRKK